MNFRGTKIRGMILRSTGGGFIDSFTASISELMALGLKLYSDRRMTVLYMDFKYHSDGNGRFVESRMSQVAQEAA